MKKLLFLSLVLVSAACFIFVRPAAYIDASPAASMISPPLSVRADAFAVSRSDFRSKHAAAGPTAVSVTGETGMLSPGRVGVPDSGRVGPGSTGDDSLAAFEATPMPTPTLSFDGIANIDNANAYGLLIIPPDMNGDVGPEHYVQVVNSLLRVYSKNGTPVTPPVKLSDIFAPLGTPCSARNDGLPNVLYDPLADRWLVSQVCSLAPPFRQMVAVSRTSDPAGQYYLYEFVMPNVKINDFPKFGVWPDGYYMTTDEFLGSDYVGNGMFGFDRTRMLSGDPSASYIYFSRPVADRVRRGGMLPADIDGLRPPAPGTPEIFATYTATEYGDRNDAIRLYDFHADFANPYNSSFSERNESPIAVAPFDPTSPPGRQDIRQPPPGEFLDSVSDRLNSRLAYRNIGDYESLTVDQTVRVTPSDTEYRAGVRVYELRRTGEAFAPAVQTTIGDAGASRWIGGVAQDHLGNIVVEYNHVSDDKQPSVYYSGRAFDDPANVFRTETALVNGTGVQKAFGWRWGEYSGMAVDPVDDCTFWMTNAYYTLESQNTSDFTWLTRIGSFKFDECRAAPRATISGTVTDAATGLPIGNAVINTYPYTRNTAASGGYGPMQVFPGTYEISASARGYLTTSFVETVQSGQSAVRDFALTPVAVLENAGVRIASESCQINGAAEPGETVTVEVAIRNTGGAAAEDLKASLFPILGVTNPSPPQFYGPLPADGAAVTRPFTFTVSPEIVCGDPVTMVLSLSDGTFSLGLLQIEIPSGQARIALQENFDRAARPNLPAGWTTTSSDGHQPWRTSAARSQSPPNSLFSPAPLQQGINEAVSPMFHVATPNAELSFKNWYDLETTFLRNRLYDGSVLEVQIAGGGWTDILEAGGRFISGGYDGLIDACCQNPLAGRLGWSGRSGTGTVSEFINTRVKLPAAAAGHDVRLRFRVGTDIGGACEGQYIDDLTVTDGYTCDCAAAVQGTIFDFDGDGKTDFSLVGLNNSISQADFRYLPSSGGPERAVFWGSSGDLPANADFDGDGKTDFAVYRPAEGNWYILNSSNGASSIIRFGNAGDRPLPFDFDGDGRADIAVFRPQSAMWFVNRSSDAQVEMVNFGVASDVPVPADYDGDGKADIAVFRPGDGVWYELQSSTGAFFASAFGFAGDVPVPGDHDGDGKADLVVFRPSTGVWYLNRTQLGFTATQFGISEDVPLRADFDGDSRSDVALFRPSTRVWYYLKSSDMSFAAVEYGAPGEQPVPSIY